MKERMSAHDRYYKETKIGYGAKRGLKWGWGLN